MAFVECIAHCGIFFQGIFSPWVAPAQNGTQINSDSYQPGCGIRCARQAWRQVCDEWREWSKLCDIRSVEVSPFAEILEAVPLVPEMVDIKEEGVGRIGHILQIAHFTGG